MANKSGQNFTHMKVFQKIAMKAKIS